MSKPITITQLLKQRKRLFSFEIFPPKTDQGVTSLFDHLGKLKKFSPDYISLTYGAGGSNQERSLELLKRLNSEFDGVVVAHFTCVGLDLSNIRDFIARLEGMDIRNILALRGDPPQNQPHFDFSKNHFRYASELVTYLKKNTALCIGVAAYPEGHKAAPSKEKDWDYLKQKVDAGAEFIITQLFFDNADFFSFMDGLSKRNIRIPVIPGILPVPSIDRLEKSINLSGSRVPDNFKKIAEKYADDPQGFRNASVDYFIRQIHDLTDAGVPGIHYYILNSSDIISEILEKL